MKKFFLIVLCLATSAHAQWRTETFDLVAGWQAIYLTVDPGDELIDDLTILAPQIEEIWRWRPDALDQRILDNPDSPVAGNEWAIWRKGDLKSSTMTTLQKNSAYLVKLADGASTSTFSIKGKVTAPQITWRTDGLNLLGFPVKEGTTPSVNAYFPSDQILDQRTEIHAYLGGPLVQNVNPARLTNRFGTIKRGAAYWIRTAKFLDYDGPLRVRAALGDGLNFGNNVSAVRLVLTNRTDAPLDAILTPTTSDTPPGESIIPQEVPLTIREVNADGVPVFNPIGASHTVTLQAGETRGLTLGLDRSSLTGSPGDEALSLLKVEDGSNLSEFYLPVSAEVSSLSGLWVGRAEITRVQNQLQRFEKNPDDSYVVGPDGRHVEIGSETGLNKTAQTFPLDLILHVDDSGNARLLNTIYHGAITKDVDKIPVFGITQDQDRLLDEYLENATRYSVVHLPPDTNISLSGDYNIGSSVMGTLTIAHDSPANPFIHTYHPDHDNLDARFDNKLPTGVESFRIDRAFTLTIDATPGEITDPSWGNTLLTGTYAETLSGLHKNPIAVEGIFALRKISNISTLTTP